ncbi:MAG: diacylglycerol kinase family protein [Chloroflexi bacterium]|nr:diacylglycerol kinase family protein [Chloroflexota bacterium]MDA1147288.1 diacylglycerol kinase family protein [Chloroflexota bacterium]
MPDPTSSATARVLIIRNPGARHPAADSALSGPLEAIRASGWDARVVDTAARGDAEELARAAASAGTEVVVACGGDGTLNETANGLVGSETALAVIPGGTANVWAREVGIAGDPAAALGLLSAGRRVRVDTGVVQIGAAEPRHFLLMCSAGIDAETVRAVEQRPATKRRLGRVAFAWPGLRALFARSVETTIALDRVGGDAGSERVAPLLLALAGNTRLYGGVLRLAGGAVMDDGALDLVTFEDARGGRLRAAARRARLVVGALRGSLREAHVDGLRYERTTSVELRPARELAVQADGEFIGVAGPDAPLRIWVAPRSLTVVVPGGVNPLFGRDGDR